MGLYLRAKFQVSSIILTSFRQGVILPPSPPPPPPQNKPHKKPTQLRDNVQHPNKYLKSKLSVKWSSF